MYGYTAVVKTLILGHCDIECQDVDGWTALHTAAMYNQADTAQALIQQGASVKTRSTDNRTPLDVAASAGHLVLVKAMDGWHSLYSLVEQSSLSPPGTEIMAKMSLASTKLRARELEHKIPCVRDCDEMALHEAACAGNTDIVERLLLNCANVNQRDKKGVTPLHGAAANGHASIAKLLLRHDADTQVTDESGCTPLHNASMHGKAEVVRLLLRYPFDLSVTDRDGWTPSMGRPSMATPTQSRY